jgi:hypothetical protein
MIAVLLLILLAILAAGLGIAVVAVRMHAANHRRAQLIPGTDTGVPDSWAGSHDPEARLHRRLRDALAALRSSPTLEYDGMLIDARVRLEAAAAEFDGRLVALWQLQSDTKAPMLADAEAAVDQVETVVAELIANPANALPGLDSAVGRLQQPPAQLDQ